MLGLIAVFSVLSCGLAQAPGDGDSMCLDPFINGVANPFFSNRVYPANIGVLMDSKDYASLLGDAPVWQQVDNDNNNSDTSATSWFQQGQVFCKNSVRVCGFNFGAQDNWLITQHISRQLGDGSLLTTVNVEIDLELNGCDSSRLCRQSVELFIMNTSTIDSTLARNTGNYRSVERLSPPDTSGDVRSNVSAEIDLSSVQESGFYLAVVDRSTCVAIHRILVFYYVCPGGSVDLVIRPETVAPESFVMAECVENSSTSMRGTNALLACTSEGVWEGEGCQCNPRYESVNSSGTAIRCSECRVGTYSDGITNSPCMSCPDNSEATQTGLAECPCVQDYYRAPDEDPSVACTRPPSIPQSVSVSNVTNTSVVLSWLPPVDGGGRDRSEIYYTIVTAGSGSVNSVRPDSISVTDTVTEVTGLTPGETYTFFIIAENAVSSEVTNIRNASISATLEEGVAGTVEDIVPPDFGSSVLSWSPPDPPNGDILHYNIRVTHRDNGTLVVSILDFDGTSLNLRDYFNEDGEFYVQIQAVTSVSAGNFSSPKLVTLEGIQRSKSGGSSNVVVPVVVVIVIVIALLGIVTFILFAYIIWYRNYVRRKELYNGGLIPLPTKGHRMFVDPTTYRHVDEAVQEFAAEIAPKCIRLMEEIGAGEFGNVYRGVWRVEKQQVDIAVKTLKPGSTSKVRNDFLTEASIMGQFDHPNVVTLHGVVTHVEPIMIVMEYMENGSLYYYLRKYDEQFKSDRLVRLAHGVAKGMEYLSKVGYVHRDLAARNILVDRGETAKVADFGLSREVVEDEYSVKKGGKIPVRWTAPEAIAYRKFTTKSDVWSFGVLMWEVMSYCQQPYESWDNQTVLDKLEAGYRLHKPKDCPETVYSIMLECWNADLKKRPTFEQVVRILEILLEGDLDDGPRPKPRSKKQQSVQRQVQNPLDFQTVDEWLESIKMSKYAPNFHASGRGDIQLCLEVTVEELIEMGVTLAGHQNKIISSIRTAQEQLNRQQSVRI